MINFELSFILQIFTRNNVFYTLTAFFRRPKIYRLNIMIIRRVKKTMVALLHKKFNNFLCIRLVRNNILFIKTQSHFFR